MRYVNCQTPRNGPLRASKTVETRDFDPFIVQISIQLVPPALLSATTMVFPHLFGMQEDELDANAFQRHLQNDRKYELLNTQTF